MVDKNKIKTIVATDCGSTTTKAILIEFKNNEYRLTFRGEAPTTVEAPFEDVTRGVLNSIIEIYKPVIEEKNIIFKSNIEKGLKIFGNKILLTQCFTNFLDNAIKYAKTLGQIPVLPINTYGTGFS